VLKNTDINAEKAKALALAADNLWNAALKKDAKDFGKSMTDSFDAQISMFPNMIIPEVLEGIEQIRENAFGWKLSGAGGGGYLVVFIKNEMPNSMKIKIRREE